MKKLVEKIEKEKLSYKKSYTLIANSLHHKAYKIGTYWIKLLDEQGKVKYCILFKGNYAFNTIFIVI